MPRGRPRKDPPAEPKQGEAPSSKVVEISHLPPFAREIDKTFGGGKIVLGRSLQFQTLPRISSGIAALDFELGGGWPRGRMHQIRGPFSSGKTTTGYVAGGQFQKHCLYCSELLSQCTCGAKEPGLVVLVDMERTHDQDRALRVGEMSPELTLVSQPDTGEQAVDIVDALIRKGKAALILIDSIATMTREEEIRKPSDEDQSPARLARLMTLGTKKWQAALNTQIPHPTQTVTDGSTGKKVPRPWPNLTTIIGLNQKRDAIGPYSAPAPGGNAWAHAQSISVQLQTTEHEWAGGVKGDNEGKHATYQTIQFYTEKNKTFPPKRYGSFRLDLLHQKIDNKHALFRYAKRNGLFELSGSWHDWNGLHVNGEANAYEQFTSPEHFKVLQKQVLAHFNEWISQLKGTQTHAKHNH